MATTVHPQPHAHGLDSAANMDVLNGNAHARTQSHSFPRGLVLPDLDFDHEDRGRYPTPTGPSSPPANHQQYSSSPTPYAEQDRVSPDVDRARRSMVQHPDAVPGDYDVGARTYSTSPQQNPTHPTDVPVSVPVSRPSFEEPLTSGDRQPSHFQEGPVDKDRPSSSFDQQRPQSQSQSYLDNFTSPRPAQSLSSPASGGGVGGAENAVTNTSAGGGGEPSRVNEQQYSLADSFQLFPSSLASTDAPNVTNKLPLGDVRPNNNESSSSSQNPKMALQPQPQPHYQYQSQVQSQSPQPHTQSPQHQQHRSWQPQQAHQQLSPSQQQSPPREYGPQDTFPHTQPSGSMRQSYAPPPPGAQGRNQPTLSYAQQQQYQQQQHPQHSQTAQIVNAPPPGPSYPIPIPISPKFRAPAQQPTYITPSSAAPNPLNPVYSPAPQQPMEEVCVECAMRDQDMADVDVTSPGVWARESDVAYEELLRREEEEGSAGTMPEEVDTERPRARGGRLTEQNLKLWLSLNPKEPASKRANLDKYVKFQRSLLEAETLAHARAMQESRQLDDRMRDTYSQLRRSAYDLGSSAAPVDDLGGVRIKPPRSSTIVNGTAGANAHGREVTLLENGMIVEHVDVKREEREERERKRREEKRERARARKSSRSSVFDVSSLYSAQSPAPHTDSGFHLGANGVNARYSQSQSPRPASTMTDLLPGTMLANAHSNASIIDAQSMGSLSPNRRTRFFGMKNFSAGWRSQDSLAQSGFSGSMVDMHVALQRENARHPGLQHSTMDNVNAQREWRESTTLEPKRSTREVPTDEKPKKKKGGLAKIWRLVTGNSSNKGSAHLNSTHTRSLDRSHDLDYPLEPPPPLSYLVNRSTGGDHSGGGNALRHVSTSSLPSTSPNHAFSSSTGVSPPTAPSSLIPSPTSSRPLDLNGTGEGHARKLSGHQDYENDHPHPSPVLEESYQQQQQQQSRGPSPRNLHSMTSEPDMRRSSQGLNTANAPPVPRMPSTIGTRPQSSLSMTWRDKSLPPIPPTEGNMQFPHDGRPRTVLTYDPRPVSQMDPYTQTSTFLSPQPAFREDYARRQSFNGLGSSPNLHAPQNERAYSGGGEYPGGTMSREEYGEFGLAPPAQVAQHSTHPRQAPSQTLTQSTHSTKRRSKFGFAALLGKKSNGHVQESSTATGMSSESPLPRSSASEAKHEAMIVHEMGGAGTGTGSSGIASSGSGHGPYPRMSMMSQKKLDTLVDQAPEFVAYRYPSNDQNLDLLR